MLNGQKLQGPATAEEVNGMLKGCNSEEKFPLFTAVHRICTQQLKPQDLIDQIRNHPEHACVNNPNDFFIDWGEDTGCGSFVPDRIGLKLKIHFNLGRPFHGESMP